MRAYKFKGAAQADHIFDIILNQRLYCAPWSVLNDPMEGSVAYTFKGSEAESLQTLAVDVLTALKTLRVCSLSKTFNSHLLWAHYANGFNGVAIEVELPEGAPDIREVKYRGVFGHITYVPNLNASSEARDVLFSKYDEWKYEQEVRILSQGEWYKLETPVTRLIAGHRLHPSLFDALQIICERQGISFGKVGIGDEGIDADNVEPYVIRQRRRDK